MTHNRSSRPVALLAAFGLAVLIAATVVGCGNKTADTAAKTTAPVGKTALESLPIAKSALATMAPDAMLLFLQSEGTKDATQAPVWGFLFGSPKTDKTYIVYVRDGKAMPPAEYGVAGLGTKEWTRVAAADEIKVDSKDALEKARAKASATATAAYSIGMLLHVPEADTTATTKPFVWYVGFDPASGAASGTVTVDAKTGAVGAK
jgi:hypothetical protein